MSALSQQLFHGSIHPFKKGDVIKPGGTGLAWSTTNARHAGAYAAMGNRRAVSEDPEFKVGDQPALFGTVYKVEPVKNDLISEEGIHASPTGFRVTGIHSLVPMLDIKEKK